MNARILIIEDETALQETLVYNLTQQGHTVEVIGDGRQGLAKAIQWQPDLLVLDGMLPGMDGLEVCRAIRLKSNLPILMLTARSDEIDRVLGLEMGADDYLTKPFSMREFLARVKALLRRENFHRQESVAPPANEQILQAGNLSLDLQRWEVCLDGAPLEMKPKLIELLRFLMQNRGQVLSRELLMERVWGWDFHGGSRTVDVHIRWLREKIEADPTSPTRIITVRGMGYRFEG